VGQIGWVITNNVYRRLLSIAVEYGLLEVFDEHIKPKVRPNGEKLSKGAARRIGPGRALSNIRNEWLDLYEEWKLKNGVSVQAA
jgi:hypothetical protein